MAEGSIGTAFVQIRPRSTGFQGELSGQLNRASSGIAGQLAKTATALVGGALLARGVSSILKIGIAYRDSLNTFQAVTEATKTQMLGVSATAKQLGNDITIPGASAADAADAMTELARAGLSVQDSMNAARGSLQLAAAGEVSAKDAANLMAAALNTFNLAGTDAVRVADLFSAAANNSAASVSDIAYGVQSAGSASHAAGFNVNELTTALSELSNAGLSGERAGTTFRSLLVSLEKPSKKAQKALDEMGVSIYDQQGKTKPLVDIIGQFQKATEHMTDAQRNANFAQIAGTYGLTALNVLVGKGTGAYFKMEEANLKQGAAADLAKAKMTGLGGSLRGFQNTAETAAISIFQKFSPSLERGVLSANKFIGSLTASSGFGQDLAAASDFATHSVEQLVGGFQALVGVAQTLSPVLTPALQALGQVGAGPLLVAVGTYKALGAAQTLVAGTQSIIARGMAAQTAAAVALAPAETRVAAAQSAAAVSAGRLAAASNTAAVAQARMAVVGAEGGGRFGIIARDAETAAASTARLAPQIETSGAAAAGASGSIRALAIGLSGMVSPTTLLIGGTALLAGGLYYLASQASSAERAANATSAAYSRLVGTSRAFAAGNASISQGKQNVADAKLQRDSATAAIANARAQVESDRKAGASHLQLAQDVINVRIAEQQWRSANSAVVKAHQDETAAITRTKAAAHAHQVQIGALTTTLAKQGQVESQAVERAARLKAAALGQGAAWDKNSAAAKAASAAISKYAASADKLATSQAKTSPVLSKATGFVANFTRETKKIPTRAEVAFILNNTKANTSYADIKKKLDEFRKSRNEARLGLDVTPFNQGAQRVLGAASGVGETVGTSMSLGVVHGINSIDISAPLVSKVRAAVDDAKKAAEAKSPSRLTARELGKPLMQGIGVGVNEATGEVLATTRTATTRITSTFISGLAGFKARAANALDFNKAFTQNIRDAITSARQNLTSLGQTVSSSLGAYLDAQNTKAIGKLSDHTDSNDPTIRALAVAAKSFTDGIARNAHDATIKGLNDAVTTAQKALNTLLSSGAPDSFVTTAADDAIAEAKETLSTLQATYGDQRETLVDALTTAQNELKTAVSGTPGTVTPGTADTGTAGSPGTAVGNPYSSGVKIAGTFKPATTGTAATDATTTGAVDPLDPIGQRAAARAVRDAQRSLDTFDAAYQRSLNASQKAVHDAVVSRTQLDTDYNQSVLDAQKTLADAEAAKLDQTQQDRADALQKALDDAVTKQQSETDNAKTQLQIQLDDLTTALDNKQIDLQTFQQSVLADITALAPNWQSAGSTLGSSFVSGIQDAIAGLLEQGALLTSGPAAKSPAGTTQPAIDPTAVQKADNATLRAALFAARDTARTAIEQVKKDLNSQATKGSEGGKTVTKNESLRLAQDQRDATKAQRDLAQAMRDLSKNAGFKAGVQIGTLSLEVDPDQAVSEFLKNLSASTGR